MDFVVWPESSEYQDGFDITQTDLNVLTQTPFGVHEVTITGELGAYCDDDQLLDINSEWQVTVEYESGLGRTTLDVIQSNTLLLDSKISLANSERNYLLSQFQLLQSIGLLTTEYLQIN